MLWKHVSVCAFDLTFWMRVEIPNARTEMSCNETLSMPNINPQFVELTAYIGVARSSNHDLFCILDLMTSGDLAGYARLAGNSRSPRQPRPVRKRRWEGTGRRARGAGTSGNVHFRFNVLILKLFVYLITFLLWRSIYKPCATICNSHMYFLIESSFANGYVNTAQM